MSWFANIKMRLWRFVDKMDGNTSALCHCEERSDAAICPARGRGQADCRVASLRSMTNTAAPRLTCSKSELLPECCPKSGADAVRDPCLCRFRPEIRISDLLERPGASGRKRRFQQPRLALRDQQGVAVGVDQNRIEFGSKAGILRH